MLDDFAKYRAKAIEASIMFLYLHELGHRTLNHVQNKDIQDIKNLAMSRSNESFYLIKEIFYYSAG